MRTEEILTVLKHDLAVGNEKENRYRIQLET